MPLRPSSPSLRSSPGKDPGRCRPRPIVEVAQPDDDVQPRSTLRLNLRASGLLTGSSGKRDADRASVAMPPARPALAGPIKVGTESDLAAWRSADRPILSIRPNDEPKAEVAPAPVAMPAVAASSAATTSTATAQDASRSACKPKPVAPAAGISDVVQAWPNLSGEIQSAILTLIQAAESAEPERGKSRLAE